MVLRVRVRRHSLPPALHPPFYLACYAHWPVKASIRPLPSLSPSLSSARGQINQPDRMETMHHQKVFGFWQAAALEVGGVSHTLYSAV